LKKYVHADVVKVIHSTDGKSMVEFLRRHDGLYEYRGHVELVDDGPYGDRRPYWSPREHSGLYETMEELERAAGQGVPWLRGPN
jgi:hypothetical protein